MKKINIYILCVFLVVMYSCGLGTKKENDHDDHDGHNHAEYATLHEGHFHFEGEEIILAPEQSEAIGIETEVIKPQAFSQIIKTSGQIIAAQGEEQTVVATMSGVVKFAKTALNEGKSVKRGESLFSISSSHLADGDPVAKARSTYEIAKGEYDRAQLLIVDKLISQKEYNEIKLTYENARIAHQAISGGGGRLGGVNISSPIAGFIKSRLVNEGQFVNMGDPLIIVTQSNKLQLRADVSERYYKDLQTVRTANFKTPYDNHLYKLSEMDGKLLSYGKSANDDTFYIPVNFSFNNVGNIIPGSLVEVYLLSGAREGVICVPYSSLIDELGLYFVYCKLTDEEYERREVKIGATDGDRIEILSGVNANDEVVTQGAYHIKLASTSESIPHGHDH